MQELGELAPAWFPLDLCGVVVEFVGKPTVYEADHFYDGRMFSVDKAFFRPPSADLTYIKTSSLYSRWYDDKHMDHNRCINIITGADVPIACLALRPDCLTESGAIFGEKEHMYDGSVRNAPSHYYACRAAAYLNGLAMSLHGCVVHVDMYKALANYGPLDNPPGICVCISAAGGREIPVTITLKARTLPTDVFITGDAATLFIGIVNTVDVTIHAFTPLTKGGMDHRQYNVRLPSIPFGMTCQGSCMRFHAWARPNVCVGL